MSAKEIVSKGVLYFVTLPTNLVGWLVIALVGVIWGDGVRWKDGVLTTTFKPDAKPLTTWYKGWAGTTLGHAIFVVPLDPFNAKRIWTHEMVHVEQVQARGILGAIVGLAVAPACWWLGLLIWALMPALAYVTSGLTALLRGEEFYMGNHEEESARAQTNNPG